jgi:hypothetical protein
MRMRLYFLLPNLASAHKVADDLLLARLEDRWMHFMARDGTDLGPLREASFLQKTDIRHGAAVGLIGGGVLGVIIGLLVINFPPTGAQMQLVTVLVTSILGSFFGMWVSSMVASAIPNSHLKQFYPEIEKGRILLMVDVPWRRAEEVRALVAKTHPEAESFGREPTIPAFP